jgi:Zn-dependent peptidase ImmA (M78 family)
MKRGFKAHAKRLALELRAEVELGTFDPFDPWALAQLYGVAIYDIAGVDCSPDALVHFTSANVLAFSGALVPTTGGLVILENPAHAEVRRRSTVSHEMAHVTLEHEFSMRLVNERGCRVANSDQEAEAAELSGELLVPFKAACVAARKAYSDDDVADHFQVSLAVARWRMNSTGARKIAQRQAAYRARNR